MKFVQSRIKSLCFFYLAVSTVSIYLLAIFFDNFLAISTRKLATLILIGQDQANLTNNISLPILGFNNISEIGSNLSKVYCDMIPLGLKPRIPVDLTSNFTMGSAYFHFLSTFLLIVNFE